MKYKSKNINRPKYTTMPNYKIFGDDNNVEVNLANRC